MGLHRDGTNFGLNDAAIKQRRRLFWECQTFDRLHSLTLGRPYAIADAHIDTLLPDAADEHEASFDAAKFRLGQLRGRIADEVFSTKPSLYSSVLSLDRDLKSLEQALHPSLMWAGDSSQGREVLIDETTTLPDLRTMRRYYLSIMIQETTMCESVRVK